MPSTHRPLVISGPSGTGKSTLLQRLFREHPDKFKFSVSHTTRKPRVGEENGRAYHFVDEDTFLKLREDGGFIETAKFASNYYGTSKKAVEDVHRAGRRCILDIEAQGVRQVKQTDLNAVYVFLAPPSMKALEARLRSRGANDEAEIEKRLSTAIEELQYALTGAHDIVIINDDLDVAYRKLEKVALGDEDVESDTIPPLLKE